MAFLLLVGSSAWALDPDLSMDYELSGYKAAAFYDFSTNSPAVLPESGDLRFRSSYGFYNFGSGNRGGDASVSVKQGQVLVCQFADTQNRSVTINSISGCTKSSTLSDGSHLFFVADEDQSTLNFNVGRAGCIVSLLVMDEDQSVTKASYTLNYINGELAVKSVNGELAVGSTVPTDASFFVEDAKYFRQAGEPESFTIAEGENNFSVKVRPAETFNYSLLSSLGETLASGSGLEGEKVYAGYPRYQLSEGKFYEAGVTNKEYRKTLALTEDNVSATVDYAAWDGSNPVVFFAEGENIAGFTVSTAGNIPVRASNAKAGTAAEDVTITSLPAGKYKFHVGTFTSKSSEQKIYIGYGENQYAFASSTNLNESASEEITLTEETAIKYFGTTSSADAQFDYIWIEKTGEYVPVVTSYTVNIADGIVGGTVVADPTSAAAGAEVTLTATPDEGFELVSYSVTGVESNEAVIVTDGKFIMPADDVTVNATFQEVYAVGIAVGMQNGAVEGPSSAAAGDKVTLTVTPAEGYELATLTITCANSGNEINYDVTDFSFTMPAEPVYIIATFQEATAMPEDNGVYYIYNKESGLFLTRGENWGTQAVAKPVGLPWKLSLAEGKYTLRMYDLTVTGSTKGFGSNVFSDNDNPIPFTFIPANDGGFKLQNGDNYITCPATAGAVTLSTTQSEWQFLNQEQYDEVLAARVAAQEAAIAASMEITIPSGKTLNDVVSDADNWAASAEVNDGVPTSDKWTATKYADRGGNLNWNASYGSEMYQCGDGHYTRTITDLKKGIYKVAIRGMKRMGNNATCSTMGDAGWKVSDSYMSANGNIIRFKSWYEDRVDAGNPNNTNQFVAIVNNGGYTTEGFVYVGDDGNLVLDASSEAYWGGSWFLFNGVSYTYYSNEVTPEDAAALIAQIPEGKMNNDVQANLTNAKTAFEGATTIANYNALQAAINAANTSIENYEEAKVAIDAADKLDEVGKALYNSNEKVLEIKGAYEAGTLVEVADEDLALMAEALVVAVKAQTTPGSDMTLAIVNPTIDGATGWTIERPKGGNGPLLNGTAFEYWAGNANPRSEGSFDYYQVIEGLPNGKYVVSAEMYNSLNGEAGAEFAATSGVYASSGNDETAKLVDVDGTTLVRYTTEEVTVLDGTLRLGVKNTVTPMAARWFVADNFTLTYVDAIKYDITVVPSENGTVVATPTSAAAGDEVTLTVTPAEGYQLASLTVTGVKSNEAVIVTDGKFIMPADDVTVSAEFIQAIYIETDLTADFISLTSPTTWKSENTSPVAAVTWAAPQVTVAGKKYAMIENYVGTQALKEVTGGVMYNEITGLTPGLYTIELYGSAAVTVRDDITATFTEGDEASLHAVTLYAEVNGEKVSKYIPCLIETDFNHRGGEESIPTATLDNVVVGNDGKIKIGLYKEVGLTNWHIVQLKSVTAKVPASDVLAKAVAKAKDVAESDVPAKLYGEIQEAITTYDKVYATADEYQAAIDALNALVAKAEGYSPLTAVLNEGEQYKANVPEGSPAEAAYDEAINDVKAAYDEVVVADIPAAVAVVEAALPALAKAQTAPNSDMTRAIVNPTIDGATGWTTEKPKGGNGPLLNGTAFEYWAGNANPRSEGSFDYYQVIEGLPSGKYIISAEMYNSTNDEAGAEFAATSGVYASSGNDETATLVDVDGTTLIRYATEEVFVKDGTLRLGVKNTVLPMAARWFVADNFTLTLVEHIVPTYTINVTPSENGTVVADPTSAKAGETVTLTATPAEGYELASISVTGVKSDIAVPVDVDELTGELSFTMPNDDVTVTATFQEAYVKLSDYAVTVDPIFVYDPEFGDEIVATITYNSEIKGSYAESFILNAQFSYEVKDADGNVVATGTKNPQNVSDDKVTAYIDGLAENTTYTINITGVEVTDFDLATFEDVIVFKDVIGLDGKPLATATFTTVKALITELNVERYPGLGYTVTEAEVDFSEAEEFLGINGVTADMLRIVNPDGTTISDYVTYDGWFDGDGKAETWGANTKINVKFFQAIPEGKYTICDMNGADVVDATYTVRWAIEANDKVAIFKINVKFVEAPVIDYTFEDLNVIETVDVNLTSELGKYYEGLKANVDVQAILNKLGENGIDDVAIFAVLSDGTLDSNYQLGTTDGWRNAAGDWQGYGDAAFFYVKANFAADENQIYEVGGMEGKNTTAEWESPATYTATYAFVKPGDNHDAVVLKVNLAYTVPTGIESTPAADGVKPDGKYLENGKIVIYKNGIKYDASGAPMNK